MSSISIAYKLGEKQKIILYGCIFLFLILTPIVGILCIRKYDHVIYTNQNVNFFFYNKDCVVYSQDYAGIYEESAQTKFLILHTPIAGTPPETIAFNEKNKTIENEKFIPLKKSNIDFTLNSFLKTKILSSDINSVGENVSQLKKYNNVSWFSEMILGEQKKCARIVDEKENILFEVYSSRAEKVESIVIYNKPEAIEDIELFMDTQRIMSLPLMETPFGNLGFYTTEGTIAVIKNKATGEIVKYEIRLYGSSGLLFVENFLTDAESIALKGDMQ